MGFCSHPCKKRRGLDVVVDVNIPIQLMGERVYEKKNAGNFAGHGYDNVVPAAGSGIL
jgi:hypothetical protein